MGAFRIVERTETEVYLELTVNRRGGVTGLSPTLAVREPQGQDYLQFPAATTFAVGFSSQAMTEVDATNSPGVYAFTLDLSAVTVPASVDFLTVEYTSSSGAPGTTPETLELVNTIKDVADQTTVDNIETDTQDIQSRLPAALVGARMDSDVGNMQTDTVDAAALATSAVNEIRDSILSDSIAFPGANIDVTISSRESEVSAAARAVTNQTEHDATQALIVALNDPSASVIADAVWDELRAGHLISGSFGEFVQLVLLGPHGSNALADGGSGTADVVTDSSNGFVTFSRVRIFATAVAKNAATLGAADGADSEIYRYEFTGIQNGGAGSVRVASWDSEET